MNIPVGSPPTFNFEDIAEAVGSFASLADFQAASLAFFAEGQVVRIGGRFAAKQTGTTGIGPAEDFFWLDVDSPQARTFWQSTLTGDAIAFLDGVPYRLSDGSLVASGSGPAVTVTVGSGGDYTTLNDAIAAVSAVRPVYQLSGFSAVIQILAGTTIAEQVIVSGIDLSWITITSADATVTIDRSALTTAVPYRVYEVDGSFTTPDAFPFVACINGARGPVLDALFSMDNAGTETERIGLLLTNRSHMTVRPGAGVQNCADVGAQLVAGSVLVADGGNFDNAGDRGIWARWGCTVSFSGGSAINAGWTAFQMHNSIGSCFAAMLTGSGHYGVRARNGSQIDARGADVSNSAGHGVNVNEGSMLNFRDGIATNCGSIDNDPAIQVTEGSTLSAQDCTVSGSIDGASMIRIAGTSLAYLGRATITANAGSGDDYLVQDSSTLDLDDASTGLTGNIPVNTVRAEGFVGDSSVTQRLLPGRGPNLTLDANGEVTITHQVHRLVPFGGAGSGADDLNNIIGGTDGETVILQTADNADPITIKHNNAGGRIRLGATTDVVLDNSGSVAFQLAILGSGTPFYYGVGGGA